MGNYKWYLYEIDSTFNDPDANSAHIYEEPIYYRQIETLKRLTDLPIEKICQLSAKDANVFINSIHKKKFRTMGWRYKDDFLTPRTVQEGVYVQVSSLSASVTIQVSSREKVELQISSSIAKI